jgi:uncharacterized protein (TIGR03435 family)
MIRSGLSGCAVWIFSALWLAWAPAGQGQTAASGAAISFEVATVRPSNLSGGGAMGLYVYPGGRIHCGFCSLQILIREAFDLQASQIEGGPKWMEHDLWNVDAIPPEGSEARQLHPAGPSAPPGGELRQMLQSLLIERFGLRYHFETREERVYWMVRNGGQLRLTPAKDRTMVPFMNVNVYQGGVGTGEMVGRNTSMVWMAKRLSDILKLMVVDKTGIDGSFDFQIPAPEAANADITNSTLEGLRHLGLKLQAEKGPVQILVVESATTPGEN